MKFLIFVFLSCVAVNSFAQNSKLSGCKSLEKLAISIMQARQASISISKLYELDHAKKNPEMDRIIKGLITKAYEKPVFSSPEYKAKAIAEYGNKTFLECIK